MSNTALAIIGCGAITESYYLPALAGLPELLGSLVLVDPDLDRAGAMGRPYGVDHVVPDFREILDRVDGVVIATPHHLHTPIALEAIERGVHVLCEKPISSTTDELDAMASAADRNGVLVTINHTRRLYTSLQEVVRLIRSGAIGEIESVRCELGGAFGWPAATNSYFGTAAGGRGVLFDFGPHVVDLVCWFLGGRPELVHFADDSDGGTEAVAHVSLREGKARADVHLSWLSALSNRYRIRGTNGTLEGEILDGSSYTHRDAKGRAKTVRTDKPRDFEYYGYKLLENFRSAIAGTEPLLITLDDVRPSVELIQRCYEKRTRLETPWYDACERLVHV